MRLLIKFPTRGRREKFFQVLDRYTEYLSGKHDTEFLITCDEDDGEMNRPDVKERFDAIPNLVYRFGQSKTKIEAVNADMDLASPWEILLLASDDMVPVARGYDDRICGDMNTSFPDLGGCLWYPDGRNALVCTLSIMGVRYFEATGKMIYHKSFQSLFADNYHQRLAEQLGRLVRFPDTIVHHAWVKFTGTDATHYKNTSQTIYQRDKETYERLIATDFNPRVESAATLLKQSLPNKSN